MQQTAGQVVRRWFDEVWNKQRKEAIAELLSPDALLHEGDDVSRGLEGFSQFFDRMQASLSDIRIVIDDEITQGDKVCVRWTCTARHTGNGLGLPPTNQQVHTTGMSIVRVAGNKIVEGWQNWDMLGLLLQIRREPKPATYMAAQPGLATGTNA
jgi:predicted ester cyclase